MASTCAARGRALGDFCAIIDTDQTIRQFHQYPARLLVYSHCGFIIRIGLFWGQALCEFLTPVLPRAEH